jgi:uncharacterized DUF497 family protein
MPQHAAPEHDSLPRHDGHQRAAHCGQTNPPAQALGLGKVLSTCTYDNMYVGFEWDANNESKPIRHGLSRAEVEEAMMDPDALAFPPRVEAHEIRYGLAGLTRSSRRVVVVVYVIRPDNVRRVVTAYPARRRVERAYQERNPDHDN